jgi:hypothetical protein
MKFAPKSEAELKRQNLCPPAIYPFSVMSAADKQSTKLRDDGSPKEMIALKLNVHGDDGDYHVYDYISPDFMAHKLRHFAVAIGLEAKYQTGDFCAADCLDRQGWCNLIIKEDSQYGPKNAVKDYCLGKTPEKEQPATTPEEDDVPF